MVKIGWVRARNNNKPNKMFNKKLNLNTIASKTLLVGGLSMLSFVGTAPSATAQVPQAECRSAFGRTVCGYNCAAGFGRVRCADWPGGNCGAAFGNVTCGPAAPANWMDYYTANASNQRRSQRSQQRSQQHLQWEYDYFNSCSSDMLDRIGTEGWEVVQVFTQQRNNTCSVLAKRPR